VRLPEAGCWVKAALHSHSTRSDGRLEPEKVVAFYESAGYRVISITDHGKITRLRREEGIVYIPGIEIETRLRSSAASYHVVLIGLDSPPPRAIASDLEKLLEWARDARIFAFIAHPYWSSLSGEDLAKVSGYQGVEVYNYGCEVEISRGYSGPHWDYALSRGVISYGLAVDDAHNYVVDALGGWVEIDVKELDEEEVMKALMEGKFYSSSGVRLEHLELREGLIHVKTNGAKVFKVLSAGARGAYLSVELLERLSKSDNLPVSVEIWEEEEGKGFRLEVGRETAGSSVKVTGRLVNGRFVELRVEGRLPLRRYARLELVDELGRAAWVNPVKVRT